MHLLLHLYFIFRHLLCVYNCFIFKARDESKINSTRIMYLTYFGICLVHLYFGSVHHRKVGSTLSCRQTINQTQIYRQYAAVAVLYKRSKTLHEIYNRNLRVKSCFAYSRNLCK